MYSKALESTFLPPGAGAECPKSSRKREKKDVEGNAYGQVDVHPQKTSLSPGNDDVQLTCHALNNYGRPHVGISTSARIQWASGVSQAYIDADRGQLVCEAAVGPPEDDEWMLYAYESLPGAAFVQLTRKRSCSTAYCMPPPPLQLTLVSILVVLDKSTACCSLLIAQCSLIR